MSMPFGMGYSSLQVTAEREGLHTDSEKIQGVGEA